MDGRTMDLPPGALQGRVAEIYFCDYAKAIADAGGMPVYLPSNVDPHVYAPQLHGLLLSGGTDIDPARYGQTPNADLLTPDPSRDAFEIALLDSATETGLPVLGICRGIQMINVYNGGTLNQHVPSHLHTDQSLTDIVHEVTFAANSLAASLYGTSLHVNSRHHQTIDTLAAGYTATGWADDGTTIEVIESDDRPWLGVQWHPEMMADSEYDPIFKWLVNTADT